MRFLIAIEAADEPITELKQSYAALAVLTQGDRSCNRMRSPTGFIVKCITSRTSAPSAVSTASISKLPSNIAIAS